MVREHAQSVVWILGSGFSKALGGPLLADLLSERSGSEAKARLAELASHYTNMDRLLGDIKPGEEVPDFALVYKIFSEHLRGAAESKGKAVHWDHAEEYLTFVDSTSGDSARREILKRWLPNEYRSDDAAGAFRRRVVQAIAAECMFAETASVNKDEAWSPYISWGKRLDAGHDSIITFNYDTVLEKLGESKEAPLINRKGVLDPASGSASGYVPIYKLHGSVDWFFNAHDEIHKSENFLRAIDGGLSPLMGAPGVSKRTVRDRFLEKVWTQAEKVLRQADVIVFLGYRSPPSDPDARSSSTPLAPPRARTARHAIAAFTSSWDRTRTTQRLRASTSSSSSRWHRATASSAGFSATAERHSALRGHQTAALRRGLSIRLSRRRAVRYRSRG
jgi:hypothetical protein